MTAKIKTENCFGTEKLREEDVREEDVCKEDTCEEDVCEEEEDALLDILKMVGLTAAVLFSYKIVKSINSIEKIDHKNIINEILKMYKKLNKYFI